MTKTQHSSNNLVLGAPKDWDQAELPCDALPVTRTSLNGLPVMLSYWTPTSDEMAVLASGGKIVLWIFGDMHPPVSVEVAA